MKCVITGQETKTHNNGTPISKEGRELLEEIVAAHNAKIMDFFLEKTVADNEDIPMSEDQVNSLKRFAPRITKKQALQLIRAEESDIMETLLEVLLEVRSEVLEE
jgi:hypothetical protein